MAFYRRRPAEPTACDIQDVNVIAVEPVAEFLHPLVRDRCISPAASVATNRYEARTSCSLLDGRNRSSVDYILATCDGRGSVRHQECH